MPLQNDNVAQSGLRSNVADAHGQAALILVESMLHTLSKRSILSTEEALAVVLSAIEVQADYIDEAGEDILVMRKAHVLLERIARSLEIDTGTADESV